MDLGETYTAVIDSDGADAVLRDGTLCLGEIPAFGFALAELRK